MHFGLCHFFVVRSSGRRLPIERSIVQVEVGKPSAIKSKGTTVAEVCALEKQDVARSHIYLVGLAFAIFYTQWPRAIQRMADANGGTDNMCLDMVDVLVEIGSALVTADTVGGCRAQRPASPLLVQVLAGEE